MKSKRNALYSLIILLVAVIYFPAQTQQKQDAGVYRYDAKMITDFKSKAGQQ